MAKAAIIILSILAGLFLLYLLVSFIAGVMFNQQVTEEVKMLFSTDKRRDTRVIKSADLEGLPDSVRQWLEYSGVRGKEEINTVRLKQRAVMRMEENESWMPVEAEQYFTVDKPGFIWKARIKAAPLFHIAGRDMYYEGKGNMLIKLLSLITIADAEGPEMDQGTLVRFMAEMVWFPAAVLNNYIEWEEIDPTTARATMSYKGVTASGVFKFNERGEVTSFSAERYRESGGEYLLEMWSISMDDYREFDGIRIPAEGEVTWKLDSGDFTWFKFEITDVDYNNPAVY